MDVDSITDDMRDKDDPLKGKVFIVVSDLAKRWGCHKSLIYREIDKFGLKRVDGLGPMKFYVKDILMVEKKHLIDPLL